MQTLALSGWAQLPTSLEAVLPANAVMADYSECAAVEQVFDLLQRRLPEPDVAVGWSLGGQLLVRAVAAGVIRPARLILLGAPFQLQADADFRGGKHAGFVAATRLAFVSNPAFMLKQFQGQLLAQGDSNARAIRAAAPRFVAPVEGRQWLFWLDELTDFSCRMLDFSAFPVTDVLHGVNDVVIPYANAEAFVARIPHARLHRMEKCGHAPHWHDANFVKEVITGA